MANFTAFINYEANVRSVPPNAVGFRLMMMVLESVRLVLTSISSLSTLTLLRVGRHHDPIHIPSPEEQSESLEHVICSRLKAAFLPGLL
jgi:hypothetical protein